MIKFFIEFYTFDSLVLQGYILLSILQKVINTFMVLEEEQAVQYFLDNAAITEAQARSEVQRYIVMPGQATAYKIGMLKIQELRAKAETELGDKFDIKAFHDTVLGGGALPLEILERQVDEWIAEQKAA